MKNEAESFPKWVCLLLHYVLVSTTTITDMESTFDFQQLQSSIQALYNLKSDDSFTLKWVDDEGDPCMLTCDAELQESIRLYNANKEPFLAVHGDLLMPD